MKYVIGSVLLATIMLASLFFAREAADEAPIESFSEHRQEADQTQGFGQRVDFSLAEIAVELGQIEAEPMGEMPLLYPNDEYMQRTVEYLARHQGWGIAEVTRLSGIHVLMEVEAAVACDAYGDGSRGAVFDGQYCDELIYESAVPLHPYYEYPLESLQDIALNDGVAAAILARRLASEDLDQSFEFALRSSALTGKVGPLLAYQADLLEGISPSDAAPVRLKTAIRQGLSFAVQLYAIDAVVAELDDSIPSLEGEWLSLAPLGVKQAVADRAQALKGRLAQMQSAFLAGGSA